MVMDSFYTECILRIASSFICGMTLGIERRKKQQAVGMKTLMLISVSSCLLGIISVTMANPLTNGGLEGGPHGDPGRIAAAVVTGVGFLGGGAILKQGLNVMGLTSAAIVWAACALGLGCGSGQYVITLCTLIIFLVALNILDKLEAKFFPRGKTKYLTIQYGEEELNLEHIQNKILSTGLTVKDMSMSDSLDKGKIELKFSVITPEEYNLGILTEKLKKTGKIYKIAISDE